MKKFIAVVAVLALTLVASVAMAEVTVSGSVDIRSLGFNNIADQNGKVSSSSDKNLTTQERIRINVDAKNDNVKGRVTIENDWDVWGRNEVPQGNSASQPGLCVNTTTGAAEVCTGTAGAPGAGQAAASNGDAGRLKIREGWLDFQIPGASPAHVKVGHQFLQLGNGWFFRSGKYGSDAWLVGLPGKNTVAFVDVKLGEGNVNSSDDIDAYVLLDNYKIDDTKTVGVYFARVDDKQGKLLASRFYSDNGAGGAGNFTALVGDEANIDTLGLWFNGKLGPLNLQAELNMQGGKWKNGGGTGSTKFKGNQLIVQANMAVADPLTVNAALAMGSGVDQNSASNDFKQIVVALDADPHYTFVYEYLTKTACISSTKFDAASASSVPVYGKNTGFCNTTALNLGAGYAVSKNLSVNVDLWMLKATEKVGINDASFSAANLSSELGNELDIVIKWKLYDNLTWNWQIGRLMPGKAYDTYSAAGVKTVTADDVDAIQGILSYKF